VIRIVRSSIGNVIQHFFSVQAISLCNSEKTNGTESTLRVDVQALSFPATHVYRQLACNGERMTQLRLPRPELPKEFSNRAGLEAT